MILFPGRRLIGSLECHQLTPTNNMVELKNPRAVCEKSSWIHGAISRNQSCKSMLTHGSKSGVNVRPQKLTESRECLGKIQIFLAQNPIFLRQNHIFFTCKPIFLNGFMSFLNDFPSFFDGILTIALGFLLSATPFYFLQRVSAFR